VVHNDLGGGVPPASTYFECAAQGQIPGDCGEGVHFVARALNAAGVPQPTVAGAYDNVIRGNVVTDNGLVHHGLITCRPVGESLGLTGVSQVVTVSNCKQ
jgi:hypothetical protein